MAKAVRPAMMYLAHRHVQRRKRSPEKELDVAEIIMLRWMCGVTKTERIGNERIRGAITINHYF